MTYKGIDLVPVITGLITLISTLIGYAQVKAGKASEELAKKSRMEQAFIRLGAIALNLAGDLWAELSAEFQQRIADGEIDVSDRAAFRAIVERRLKSYATSEELEKLAAAAGLPMPGIIGWVAEWIIDRLTKAHDVDIKESASPLAYPVSYDEERADIEKSLSQGG